MVRNTLFGDPSGTSSSSPRASGALILVVEDDAATAFMLTDVLESTDCQCHVPAASRYHMPVLANQMPPDASGLIA